jgi:hypothetical protein
MALAEVGELNGAAGLRSITPRSVRTARPFEIFARPLAMTVALTALELPAAFLQA